MAVTSKNPQRVKAGRLGGLTASASANVDTKKRAQHAQAAFLARFEREADPDGVLDQAERTRRAVALRRLFLLRIRGKA